MRRNRIEISHPLPGITFRQISSKRKGEKGRRPSSNASSSPVSRKLTPFLNFLQLSGERFAIVYRRRPSIDGGCFIAWPKDLGFKRGTRLFVWLVERGGIVHQDCLPRPCLARVGDKLSYKLSRDGDEDALRWGRTVG